jgi:conjugative relaxase-like TrwC/TraI family protein
VTVSVRVMSAGDGYRYLLRTIVAGDGMRSLSTPLARYYAEEGTPPGRWLGAGVAGIGDRALSTGDEVTAQQLQLLLGMGRDPVDGTPLGRAYPEYASVADRVAHRVEDIDAGMGDRERAAAVAVIEAEERAAGSRRAVAGYDFTFSVPKSVSTLWAVADAATQERIVAIHHQAIDEVLGFLEREVAATRVGVAASDGAVAQVEVAGVIAAAYDHYDSRAGDPHLHTHVVLSNKVQAVLDGRWRSLDGRPLLASAVALSELHEALVADLVTSEFGVGWVRRERGRDRNPVWDVGGVPLALLEQFSSRSAEIDREKDRLIDAYRADHGRMPSARVVVRLRAQATLSTRPAKQVRSLQDLTTEWRPRAGQILGTDAAAWASSLLTPPGPELTGSPRGLSLERVEALAAEVVEVVGEKRSTWRRWNLHAEASRQLKGVRFAGMAEREAATRLVVEAAERLSFQVSPEEVVAVPPEFQRADGTSVFRPRHSTLFTSTALLEAEERLLEHSRTVGPTVVPVGIVWRVLAGKAGRRLIGGQTAAVRSIATSGRVLEVLVGPAGAGKTTTMTALRAVWEASHGRGSVVGLAPSAIAADVLATELGIPAENTAKWIHDHTAGLAAFRSGQLVIVDEASLAGTRTLDTITAHAASVGARVLLVGDHAQLQAVDAGGAVGMLVHDRGDAPELTDVHRFRHGWEKTASIDLRHGLPAAIDAYVTRGRVRAGDTEQIIDAAYRAWRADLEAGKTSVLVAPTVEVVRALNDRARADRVLTARHVSGAEVELTGGSRASVGETVITRRNDRTLHAGRTGWVRNGDRWTITRLHDDGQVTLRRAGYRYGATVRLPATYVSQHVDLGYAVTGHGAQGITVDTGHAVVIPGTTREQLYVALTRGRQTNTAYVATDRPEPIHAGPHPGEDPDVTAVTVLHGILRHTGAERSAHESIHDERERWGSIAQLAAEYETIAAAAQHDRWSALIRATPLTCDEADAVIASPTFGALSTELRRAEAFHHDVDRLLPRLVTTRDLTDASDIGAVLHQRLTAATLRPAGTPRARRTPRLIAGLVPKATGTMTDPMRQALTEREELLDARAALLVDRVIADGATWVNGFGPRPPTPRERTVWTTRVGAIAAFRERYDVATTDPLGPVVGDATRDQAREHLLVTAQHRDSNNARAERLSRSTDSEPVTLGPGAVVHDLRAGL